MLYETYQELLVERSLTEEDLILDRLEQLRNGAGEMPETTALIMYGFTDLTPLQSDYLNILEFWFDIEFIIDPTTAPYFEMVARHFPVKFPQPEVIPLKTALERLQALFWGREPSTLSLEPVDLSLQMIEAAGTDREITAIAREIVKLLSEDHYRWTGTQ